MTKKANVYIVQELRHGRIKAMAYGRDKQKSLNSGYLQIIFGTPRKFYPRCTSYYGERTYRRVETVRAILEREDNELQKEIGVFPLELFT